MTRDHDDDGVDDHHYDDDDDYGDDGDDDDGIHLVGLKAVQSRVVRKVEGLQTIVAAKIWLTIIFRTYL